jgi:hypothetical protein
MRVADIIRSAIDLLDRTDPPAQQVRVVAVPAQDDDEELARMRQIAGLVRHEPQGFQNAPDEHISDIEAVLAGGTDMNKPKHPADIRTNAPSMFPGFQSRG